MIWDARSFYRTKYVRVKRNPAWRAFAFINTRTHTNNICYVYRSGEVVVVALNMRVYVERIACVYINDCNSLTSKRFILWLRFCHSNVKYIYAELFAKPNAWFSLYDIYIYIYIWYNETILYYIHCVFYSYLLHMLLNVYWSCVFKP